ncbi:hypothetical protein [Marinovum sp. KMM 9879]
MLLEEIANGGYPSVDQVAAILPNFNDGEHIVWRARDMLGDDRSAERANLTLRATRVLREIESGKGGLRKRIQHLLNYSLTYGEPIAADHAKKLIHEIELLNEAIELAEEKLAEANR